jgi:DNA-binding NtrC family response regulator
MLMRAFPEPPSLPGERPVAVVAGDFAPLRAPPAAALRRAGFETVEADGAEAALEILREREGETAVLVTAWPLALADGRELAVRVMRERPELPLVVVAYREPPLAEDVDRERVAVVTAPLSIRGFLRAVGRVLRPVTGEAWEAAWSAGERWAPVRLGLPCAVASEREG